MRETWRPTLIIGVASVVLWSTTANADEWIKPGEETLQLSVGGLFAQYDTEVTVNNARVGGGGSDLEDDLDFDEDEFLPTVGLTWRIAPRHRLNLGYYVRSDRSSSFVAEENIDIGDGEVISVGAAVSASFKFELIPLTYQYSFIKTPNHEFAGSVGLHWGRVEFDVSASAWIEDIGGTESVSADTELPIPMIGLAYDYWINDRWAIKTSAEAISVDFNIGEYDFNGYSWNIGVGTEYWIWNNVGVGASINSFGVDVDVGSGDWSGDVEYSYWGPMAYLTARF